MSYSFVMSFMEAKTKAEAYEKAEQFVAALTEPEAARAWIKENLIFFTRRSRTRVGEEIRGTAAFHLEDWLSALFDVRFTYWPEYNLLGIVGRDWPKACMALTSEPVLFQNSCDQNYDYDLWPKLPFFQERVAKAKNVTFEAALKEAGLTPEDIGENTEEAMEYWRRSMVYHLVEKDLDLHTWLYDYKKSTKYHRFALSGIVGMDMQTELFTRAVAVLEKEKV